MASVANPSISIDTFRDFQFVRVLNEDPQAHSFVLLGTLPRASGQDADRSNAILIVNKTPFNPASLSAFATNTLTKVETIGANDIYTWLFGWLDKDADADVKMTLITDATEVHIRKYSKQTVRMITETADMYEQVVVPYIQAFPSERINWVYNILAHKKEADKILYEDPSPTSGFLILPDLKWDQKTLSTLYLLAIAHTPDIKTLRDLNKSHIPMLKAIRKEGTRVAKERWGILTGSLRFFVHYQPSYYHFHVHIVEVNYDALVGMRVGQAHLLDDLISLLELDVEGTPSILWRMTLTYGLGEEHGLYEPLAALQPQEGSEGQT